MVTKIHVGLLVLVLIIVAAGCSGDDHPLNPDPGSDSGSSAAITPSESDSSLSSRYLIGYWSIVVNEDHTDIDIIPVRSLDMHFNAVRMLEESPCTDCLTISNINATGPNEISIDLTIRHPFSDNLNLTGFDVRGIFISDGDYNFPATGRTAAWGDTLPLLLNCDGYTSLYNPTEFPADLPVPPALKYYPGKFSPVTDLSATLNPYVAYFETAPRRMFIPGMEKTEQVQLYIPDGGFKFGYAIDMSWMKPDGAVVDPVNDFPIEANCLEAYQITSALTESITSKSGNATTINVGVYDHQGLPTIADVIVEAPDLFAGSINLDYSGQIAEHSWLYSGEIINEAGAGPGSIPLLIRVIDTSEDPNLGAVDAWEIMEIDVVSDPGASGGWAITSELGNMWCNEIVSDGSGNLYLTGTEAIAIKVDVEGNIIWTYNFDGGFIIGDGIDLDSAGNVYITGCLSGEADFDQGPQEDVHVSNGATDTFLVKLDNDGNYIWGKNWGGDLTGDNGYYEAGFGVVVDLNGDIFCCGNFRGLCDFDPGPGLEERTSNGNENAGFDAYVSSFDASGEFRWVQIWGSDEIGPSNNPKMGERPSGIAVDTMGGIFVTGGFSGTVDFDPGSGTDEKTSISDYGDVFLLKWTSDGDYVWVRTWAAMGLATITGITSQGWGGKMITTDNLNNIIVKSIYDGPVDLDPGPVIHEVDGDGAALSKFDPSGNLTWVKTWTGYDFFTVFGSGVCTDSENNIYTGGAFQWQLDLDPGGGEEIHWGWGYRDAYIVKLDPDGEFYWGNSWGPADSPDMKLCETWDICVDELDNPYCCGFFTGSVDFDPGDGTDVHEADNWTGFLAKFTPEGTW